MKKIIALLLAMLMVFALVACGQTEVEEVETTEEVVEETTEETAEPKPYEGINLIYWSSAVEGTEGYELACKHIDAWEELTGATVEYSAWGQELSSMAVTALDAGEKIDIVNMVSIIQLSKNMDHLLQLDDLLAQTDLEERGYEMAWDQIRNWTVGAEGRAFAVPASPSFSAWWYDKALFEKAGIEAAPTTIEEFEEVCDKLLAIGVNPIAQDAAYVHSMVGTLLQNYASEEVVRELIANGGWTENEDAIACFDKLIEWVNKGYFDPSAPGQWPASQNKIGLTGENAMVYCGSWVSGEIEEMTGADIDWGCFLMPNNPDGKGVYGTALSNGGIAITKDCEHPEVALDLINYLKSGEVGQATADEGPSIPYEKTGIVPEKLGNAMEVMNSMEAAIDYTGGLHSNPDIKTSVTELLVNILSGVYANGMEACEAFDALCK